MSDRKQVDCAGLQITPVDPDSPIPLYYQVEADLRRLINSGELSPGTAFPPELKLCQDYGVGRHTVRKALSRLNADNLIVRYAGRGTFVKQPADRKEFLLDRSFTHQMAEMGKHPHSKVLELSERVISEDSPRLLQKYLGARCLYLARLRFGDEEPIGLQYTAVITELCPGLGAYDFNQNSLYDVLSRDYGLVITEIHHTVNAVAADAYQAQLLQVAEGESLLLVKTTAFLDNHQIVEHTVSYYRADKYEYSITQSYSS
jgi:GntR family transcriptional regulator